MGLLAVAGSTDGAVGVGSPDGRGNPGLAVHAMGYVVELAFAFAFAFAMGSVVHTRVDSLVRFGSCRSNCTGTAVACNKVASVVGPLARQRPWANKMENGTILQRCLHLLWQRLYQGAAAR